jgi:hypothetical protein
MVLPLIALVFGHLVVFLFSSSMFVKHITSQFEVVSIYIHVGSNPLDDIKKTNQNYLIFARSLFDLFSNMLLPLSHKA